MKTYVMGVEITLTPEQEQAVNAHKELVVTTLKTLEDVNIFVADLASYYDNDSYWNLVRYLGDDPDMLKKACREGDEDVIANLQENNLLEVIGGEDDDEVEELLGDLTPSDLARYI